MSEIVHFLGAYVPLDTQKPLLKCRHRLFYRLFCLLLLLVFSTGAFSAGAAEAARRRAEKRPNIILILADDLGYSDLGCYGNNIIHTPHLDRFATQGVRLTQFYVPFPACSPTRAAILTGHYPQRYGIFKAEGPENLPRPGLPETAVTIAEVLRQAGYYTAHIGKWHLGEPPDFPIPRKQGFDFFAGTFGGRPSSSWIKYARSMDPEVIVNEDRPVVYPGHVTQVQTGFALEILSKAPRDRPFFLNIWYNAPHEPLAPLPDQDKLYKHWQENEQVYFQTVTDLDLGIGKILTKLDELEIAEETLVIFTSDNGPEAHKVSRLKYSYGTAWPLKGMKTQLWEGGIRVPAIVRWPDKLPPQKSSDLIASALDLFPTFCAAAGITVPANLDGGTDLMSALRKKGNQPERPLFFEAHESQRGVEPSLPLAVRKGKWKLFANDSGDQVQLYNLHEDVRERQNVAQRHPELVKELYGLVRNWWGQFAGHWEVYRNAPRKGVPTPSLEELQKSYYHSGE